MTDTTMSAAAPDDEPENLIPRYRGAALGKLGQHARRPGHRHPDILRTPLPDGHGRRGGALRQLLLGAVHATELCDKTLYHVPGRDMPFADRAKT